MADDPQISMDEIDEWHEEESESEAAPPSEPDVDPGTKYMRSQLRVVRETKDYQLDYLQHALRPGRELIDISPAYQRRLRWPIKKKSLLIESFLLNIPVPPIFLFERDYNEYEVIDGRQRLESIRGFLSNEFALAGLEYWPELNRQRFSELPPVLQKGLLRRSLSAVVLLAETEKGTDDLNIDVRRVLFDRLNTGGVRLNPQELRNALYPGVLNKTLIELARSSPFTDVWGIPSYVEGEEENPPEKLLRNPLFASLTDAELVLRYFALRDAIENSKKGSLRSILDRYMEDNSNIDKQSAELLKEQFVSQIRRLFDVFQGVPFRLPTTRRPSRPLYDALMVALSRAPELDIEGRAPEIRAALQVALENEETYDVLVGRGNTIEAVRERVSLADEILRAGIK